MIPAPTVSVVIPVYNRSATIEAAIRSVLRQTYTDFEVLVVDDGSDDGTVNQVRRIEDHRVRLIALRHNQGVSAARNAGIAEARAPWVAFQDSDDEWLPEKLAQQMHLLENGDFIAAYCGMAIVDRTPAGRTELRYVPPSSLKGTEGQIHDSLALRSFVSTQTLVVRTEALRLESGFDINLKALVDWDLALRLARRGAFAFVDAPLVLQHFSENSITRSVESRVAARELILFKHHDAFASIPRALAVNARAVAGGWRRLGDKKRARAALAIGLRAAPFDPYLRLSAMTLALTRKR